MDGSGRTLVRLLGAPALCAATLGAALTGSSGVAQAASGDPVKLGMANSASATTGIITSGGSGLNVTSTDPFGAGVLGTGEEVGVHGESPTTGVIGESSSGTGVHGTTSDNTQAGVFGENTAATGSGGSGVVGIANNNIGVSAISANGTALGVSGTAVFSRSGKATVPSGSKKVVVNNIKLFSGSMILALVQVTGAPAVKAAVPDVANNRFTIYLAGVASKNVVVAWFVLS